MRPVTGPSAVLTTGPALSLAVTGALDVAAMINPHKSETATRVLTAFIRWIMAREYHCLTGILHPQYARRNFRTRGSRPWTFEESVGLRPRSQSASRSACL